MRGSLRSAAPSREGPGRRDGETAPELAIQGCLLLLLLLSLDDCRQEQLCRACGSCSELAQWDGANQLPPGWSASAGQGS